MFAGLAPDESTRKVTFSPSERASIDSEREAAMAASDEDVFPGTQSQVGRDQDPGDEQRLDEILDRLHRSGKENISAEDRAFLERVSQRFRQRKER